MKKLSERIDEIMGDLSVEVESCYDDITCHGHMGYIDGRSDATQKLVKLFEQYLQAELQKRGITGVI